MSSQIRVLVELVDSETPGAASVRLERVETVIPTDRAAFADEQALLLAAFDRTISEIAAAGREQIADICTFAARVTTTDP